MAYCDWSQQEFGIAAALSGDKAIMNAYSSGDPYLTFAKQAGAVPADATKQSHPAERELFKTCALGVQYGMGEYTLAVRLGQPPAMARELLRSHRQTYDQRGERQGMTGSTVRFVRAELPEPRRCPASLERTQPLYSNVWQSGLPLSGADRRSRDKNWERTQS